MAPQTRSKSPGLKSPSAKTPRKSRGSTPKIAGRPQLPLEHKNTQILASKKIHPVKEQTLTLEHERILIYRQKVPTPRGVSGHIIRRTDTNAVSASSLFRSAFPTAPLEVEEVEMQFLTTKYDTVNAGRENEPNNQGRLTGKWIPTADAFELAEEYGLAKFCGDLLRYDPETNDKENEPVVPASPTSSAVPDASAATDTTQVTEVAESRASKRARLSNSSAATQSSVTVEQSISTDPATGVSTETTRVSIDAAEPSTSDDTTAVAAEEQIRSAKELVETLKKEHLLQSLSDAPEEEQDGKSKKRSIEDAEVESPVARRKRWFGSAKSERSIAAVPARLTNAAEPMTASKRRLISFATLAVVGAAT